MEKYRVKLLEGHKAKEDQNLDGYLGNGFTNVPEIYSRGEAIKKAKMFGGEIEPYKGSYQITDVVKVCHIPEANLPENVKKAFENVEPTYVDTDKTIGEKIYYVSSILEDMLDGADNELQKELVELYHATAEYSYVCFTKI